MHCYSVLIYTVCYQTVTEKKQLYILDTETYLRCDKAE